MDWKNRKLNWTLGVAALFFTLLKLFTSVVTLHDDTSVFLVLRITPSLDNYVVATAKELPSYIVLLSDENSFIGESFYELLTGYFWWFFLVGFI
ncbi:MAG: hypothetical protein KAG43_04375, partial [Candidatus Marithrix sp.]|nr:hypothetical protein [Candidatus Marithrix sp.]